MKSRRRPCPHVLDETHRRRGRWPRSALGFSGGRPSRLPLSSLHKAAFGESIIAVKDVKGEAVGVGDGRRRGGQR
jgi:hypothetical protein